MLIVGGTGFVGRHLGPALAARGWDVRIGSRRSPSCTVDLDRPETLAPALAGCDAAVYLVHRMADPGDLADAERRNARAFRDAAERAGLRRVVYLGGPTPAGVPSEHLASRIATGEILRGGSVSTIELRAGMIVGEGSESWTICRDLALRLPVMLLPSWLGTRSQPIGIDDVVGALADALDDPHAGSAWFDLPGPETLTARAILERIAAIRGMRPVMVPVPVLTPRLSSAWLKLVTRADYRVARKLVEGLAHDLVSEGPSWWTHVGRAPEPFDDAARKALLSEGTPDRGARWERLAARVARHA